LHPQFLLLRLQQLDLLVQLVMQKILGLLLCMQGDIWRIASVLLPEV
jgi:hypothetical protein